MLPDPSATDVLVVGAALLDDLARPRFLLAARRTAPPLLAGGWELPGGKVDPGEGPVEALHRELAEELGVRVRLGEQVLPPAGGDWPLPPSARLRVWTAQVTHGTPRPLQDHDMLTWLPLERAMDVAWLTGDVPVVTAVCARYPTMATYFGDSAPRVAVGAPHAPGRLGAPRDEKDMTP